MQYKPTWDLRSIPDGAFFEELRTRPDAPLYSEAARRRGANSPRRAKVLRPCPKCGAMLGARELRAHKCDQKIPG